MLKTLKKNTANQSSSHTSCFSFSSAFTIVELLVVIVVIAVLAAITIVSYAGVTAKADSAAIKSELETASKQLALFQTTNDYYPTTNDCSTATSSTNICLKLNTKYNYTYTPNKTTNPTGYVLYSSYNNTGYNISNTSSLTTTANLAEPDSCPTGFIPVPGSATYNTSGFCVMKYEAKIYGNDTGTTGYSSTNYPNSRASGTPYVNISQTNAITQAAKTVDQSGNTIANAHLITEGEWMTLAQNVLSVASNWSTGTVGSGYIYSGHNDNNPASALAASTDDSDGYYGTGNSSSSGANQKRTLTLTNGEVIWDLAGNVWDWTSGQTTGGQPGISGGGYAWRNYTAITTTGSLSVNIFPSGTGISGASSWTSTNGIGQIYSSADETAARAFLRGGNWDNGGNAGVLALNLNCSPSNSAANIGLRVSR